MNVRSFNPVQLLAGPIFQRETRAQGRRFWTYFRRAGYAAILLFICFVAYRGVESGLNAGGTARLERLQALQSLAPALTVALAWFQMAALCLLAPLLAGGAICDERRMRTLDTLLTTPLSAAHIIFGKFSSLVVELVILALLATPVLLALRVFGGVDAEVVLGSTTVSVTTALLGVSLGLLFSIWHRRGASAGVFGGMALALITLGPIAAVAIWFVLSETGAQSNGPPAFLLEIIPISAPVTLGEMTASIAMGGSLPTRTILGVTAPTWAVCGVYQLILTFLVLVGGTFSLRRTLRREAEGLPPSPLGSLFRRRRRSEDAAPAPAVPPAAPSTAESAASDSAAPAAPKPSSRPDRKASREVWDNPVLWREVRQSGLRRGWVRRLGAAALIVGLVLLYFRYGLDDEGLHLSVCMLSVMAIMLQATFTTAGGIVTEREARTWETLMTTPLGAVPILLGKFVGALRAQWLPPAVLMGHILLSVALGHMNAIAAIHAPFILLGPMLWLTATGLLMSLLVRRSTVASALNLGVALLTWLGPWVSLVLINFFSDWDLPDRFNQRMADFFLAANPVAAMNSAVDGALRYSPGRYSLGTDQTLAQFTNGVAVTFIVYAALAALVLAACRARFNRAAGRSS